MSKSLSVIFPAATHVSILGREVAVWPLTLGDLAELQRVLDYANPHPLEERRKLLATEDKKSVVSDVYKARQKWKPWTIHQGDGQEYLWGPRGRIVFLNLVTRNSLSASDLLEVVAATYEDADAARAYQEIMRIAYESDADVELERMIQEVCGELGEESDDEPEDLWAQKVCEVAEAYGWSLDYIRTLTIKQFTTALRRGAPVKNTSNDLRGVVAKYKHRREVLLGDSE